MLFAVALFFELQWRVRRHQGDIVAESTQCIRQNAVLQAAAAKHIGGPSRDECNVHRSATSSKQ